MVLSSPEKKARDFEKIFLVYQFQKFRISRNGFSDFFRNFSAGQKENIAADNADKNARKNQMDASFVDVSYQILDKKGKGCICAEKAYKKEVFFNQSKDLFCGTEVVQKPCEKASDNVDDDVCEKEGLFPKKTDEFFCVITGDRSQNTARNDHCFFPLAHYHSHLSEAPSQHKKEDPSQNADRDVGECMPNSVFGDLVSRFQNQSGKRRKRREDARAEKEHHVSIIRPYLKGAVNHAGEKAA